LLARCAGHNTAGPTKAAAAQTTCRNVPVVSRWILRHAEARKNPSLLSPLPSLRLTVCSRESAVPRLQRELLPRPGGVPAPRTLTAANIPAGTGRPPASAEKNPCPRGHRLKSTMADLLMKSRRPTHRASGNAPPRQPGLGNHAIFSDSDVLCNRYARRRLVLDEDRYPFPPAKELQLPHVACYDRLKHSWAFDFAPATRGKFVLSMRRRGPVIRGKLPGKYDGFRKKKEFRGGVRDWRRDGKLYRIPINGPHLDSLSLVAMFFDRNDLLSRSRYSGLTAGSLAGDYGPLKLFWAVNPIFIRWLPWSAEMHRNPRPPRHHPHDLTDYIF